MPLPGTIGYQLVSIGGLLRDIGNQLIKIGHEMIVQCLKLQFEAITQKLEKPKAKWSFKDFRNSFKASRLLVFDTETTTDQYQNLKIGSFQIFHDGYFQYEGLFYDPTILSEKEIKILETYSRKHDIRSVSPG